MRTGSRGVIVPDDCPTFHAAIEHLRSGLPITLCKGKKPLGIGWSQTERGRNWQRKRWTDSGIRRAFEVCGPLNVGVRLGPVSGIIDIEADGHEEEQAFAELFEGCDPLIAPTFESERGKHRLFAWEERLQAVPKAKTHFHGLEIRLGANEKGAQSLLPPSINENATQRRWLVPLDECRPPSLPDVVLERIVSANRRTKLSTHKPLPACAESVGFAASAVLTGVIQRAIALTLPTGPGQRNRRIFAFVQALKAMPELAALKARALRPHVVDWHKAALPFIRTKDFAETWLDFGVAWTNAKFAAGEEPIVGLFQQALCRELPTDAHRYEGLKLRQLVALCRELQIIAGQSVFFLDCRTAGQLLGASHVQANKWLRVLALDEVIKVEKVGTRGTASEYRYLGKLV